MFTKHIKICLHKKTKSNIFFKIFREKIKDICLWRSGKTLMVDGYGYCRRFYTGQAIIQQKSYEKINSRWLLSSLKARLITTLWNLTKAIPENNRQEVVMEIKTLNFVNKNIYSHKSKVVISPRTKCLIRVSSAWGKSPFFKDSWIFLCSWSVSS